MRPSQARRRKLLDQKSEPIGSVLLAGVTVWWGLSIGLAVLGAVSVLAAVIIAIWARRLWVRPE